MALLDKDQWVQTLIAHAHDFKSRFRPMRHEEYIFQLNFVHLFETVADQLEGIYSCKSNGDFDRYVKELSSTVFTWPHYKERDYESEIRALWTGDEYERLTIISSANREADRLMRMQTLVGRLTRSEIKRLPPLKELPPMDPNISKYEIPKLQRLKAEIDRYNADVNDKKQKLEEILLSLSTYLNEIRYKWFVSSIYFRNVVTSSIYHLKTRLNPPSSPEPLAKRNRSI